MWPTSAWFEKRIFPIQILFCTTILYQNSAVPLMALVFWARAGHLAECPYLSTIIVSLKPRYAGLFGFCGLPIPHSIFV